jgi:hypothetical protein
MLDDGQDRDKRVGRGVPGGQSTEQTSRAAELTTINTSLTINTFDILTFNL